MTRNQPAPKPYVTTRAVPLYKWQGSDPSKPEYVESGVYSCSNCRHVANEASTFDNDNCLFCVPHEQRYPVTPCITCGAMVRHKYENKWCDSCSYEPKIQAGTLILATEADIPDLPLSVELNEKYFPDMEELMYLVNDDLWQPGKDGTEGHFDISGRPKYAHITREVKMQIDADSVIEDALSDSYEDSECDISGAEAKELQDLLDGWLEKHGLTWYESTCRIVEIPWARFDAENAEAKEGQ